MCLDILEIFCGENIRQCLCYIVLGIVCCPVAVPYLIYKATCGKDEKAEELNEEAQEQQRKERQEAWEKKVAEESNANDTVITIEVFFKSIKKVHLVYKIILSILYF